MWPTILPLISATATMLSGSSNERCQFLRRKQLGGWRLEDVRQGFGVQLLNTRRLTRDNFGIVQFCEADGDKRTPHRLDGPLKRAI